MKRDMDLVRKILFAIEEKPHGLFEGKLHIERFTSEQIGYHVYLMIQSGLIEGSDATSMDDNSPCAMPRCLTWYGHDFLDASRDEERWITAKEIIGKVKGASFDIVMMILTELMKKQVLGL